MRSAEEEDLNEISIPLVHPEEAATPQTHSKCLYVSIASVSLGFVVGSVCLFVKGLPSALLITLSIFGVALMTPILYIFFRLYQQLVPRIFPEHTEDPAPDGEK